MTNNIHRRYLEWIQEGRTDHTLARIELGSHLSRRPRRSEYRLGLYIAGIETQNTRTDTCKM